jgi:uncharacterized DUF497 family protein
MYGKHRVPAVKLDVYAQMCIYLPVSYEWDPGKAQANSEKHGIYFADVAITLEDDLALTVSRPVLRRRRTLDHSRQGCCWPSTRCGLHLARDHARLISARLATEREKSQYEEHHEA